MLTDFRRIVLVLLLLACFCRPGAAGVHDCGELGGRVVDAVSGAPLPQVNLQLEGLDRGTVSDSRGDFAFRHIPAGDYCLLASHVRYGTTCTDFSISCGDTLELVIHLQETAWQLDEVRIAVDDHLRLNQLHQPVLRRESGQLQQELGLTIAETLEQEAGIARRSMGPAPARPVLRGLSGNRLLLLEDGMATGDLSATSADHAVAIEALAAEGLELLRGPESLLYGAGAQGGVVNVQRGLVPEELLARPRAVGTVYTDTALPGAGGSLALDVSRRNLSFRLDASAREAAEMETPAGSLDNSSISTTTLGAGLALLGDHGRIGLGISSYDSDYGIPGGFVGGHPEGVEIRLEKRGLKLEAEKLLEACGIESIRLAALASRYYHAEYEAGGQLGIDFGALSIEPELELRLQEHHGLDEGRIRLSASFRDFATGGLSHAPDTDEWSLGLAWLEHARWADWHLSAALRAEHKRVIPDEERFSVVIGSIRERSFSGLAASLKLDAPRLQLGMTKIETGLGLSRSWRPPSVEELFSGGPHLAAYSYEIGNPELGAENVLSVEVPLVMQVRDLRSSLTLYASRYSNFIFPSFTGEFSARRADLYEYRTMGRDAQMTGFEWTISWRPGQWELESRLSAVRGELEGGGPLPEIPPASGLVSLHRRIAAIRTGLAFSFADRQDRVYQAEDPDAIPELETAGWGRLDADLMWSFSLGNSWNQLHVRAENLLDHEYRHHLSRIRSIMPEAGRGLKLTWRSWL